MDNIIYSSAVSIREAIKKREISSVEVVEAHLRRIEQVNPKLNAVVRICGDRAMEEARQADSKRPKDALGPLHGVPITVKDSHDTEGIVSTAGTKGRAQFVPSEDSTVVSRMRKAGAIVLGKTNTPELTLSFETDNLVYGRTNNPYDLTRTPGGSSGGAGAIVAAGGSPIDLGTDTGGSIRVPSGFCGIAGLKPTSGRVPRTGHIISHVMGALDSLTTIGPMAKFVEDLSVVYPIISGSDHKDPSIVQMSIESYLDVELKYLKIAYFADIGDTKAEEDVVHTLENAVSVLRSAGSSLTRHLPEAMKVPPEINLLVADGGASIQRLLTKSGTDEPHNYVSRFIGANDSLSVGEYTKLLEKRDVFRSEMINFMSAYDLILCPVRPYAPLPHGESLNKERMSGNQYTSTFNMTGWPGVVVRCGTSGDGLPIGLQVIGRPWHEHVALAAGALLERELVGWQMPNIK